MTRHGARLREAFGAGNVATLRDVSPALSSVLTAETPVVLPDSPEMLQEVLRLASREGLRVLPAGNMEHSIHGGLPEKVDLVLCLRRLATIVDFEPGDLTLVVQAGVTLGDIEAQTREAAQRLAADPWPATAATIGGAVATNRHGPARLRAGTLRDALLGCRVVHADGTVTRSGGRVVKNVTGFDLPKLFVGSMGTLVVLLELNLRLRPRPQASALVGVSLPAAQARERLLEVFRRGTEAAALVVYAGDDIPGLPEPNGTMHLLARFEGRDAVVEEQARACATACKGDVMESPRAEALWTALRRQEEPDAEHVVMRVASLPTDVCAVIESLDLHGGEARSALGLFGVGRCSLRLPATLGSEGAALLQSRLQARGWTVQWVHTGGFDRAMLGGSAPASAGLHMATKRLFDPQGILPPAPWQSEGAAR